MASRRKGVPIPGKKISERVLMVNSLSVDPISHGGTFYFKNGAIQNKLAYDIEDILVVEI